MSLNKLNIAVLISGNGSNLQSIIDAVQAKTLNVNIKLVISNIADAYGLERAKLHNIPCVTINEMNILSPHTFETELLAELNHYAIDLIVLAGFMRILKKTFISAYQNKIINLHPSLLPAYPGLHTHERALQAHDKFHGCSIHFVTPKLDSGPIIAQAILEIEKQDNPETLKQRVQKLEHLLYPRVIGWFADNRISLQQNKVSLDNKQLPSQGYQFLEKDL